jgi:ABC-2 type transport system ATP-binding protein
VSRNAEFGKPGVLAVIEARGLTKRYGSTVAVDGLDFDVQPGRVTGFLGPNGAGKTTTMRLVLGLDRPSAGVVTVAGKRYADYRFPLYEVGALLDAKAVHGGRRAREHLLCLAQSNRIPRRRVDEALELVGLADVARRRIGTFSLGMSQRLGIAAALLGDPEVLIFDEPVNGLDPEGIVWIRNLFRSLADEGRTVFVSSHLMTEMALTADHLIVIGRGKLIADESIVDLLSRGSGRVRVASPDATRLGALLVENGGRIDADADGAIVVRELAAPAIGEIAARHGIVLHELTPEQASLEETFFELTDDSVEFHGEAVPAAEAGR